MEIKILGLGCPSCHKLENSVKKTAGELKMEVKIIKVENLKEIMSFGVLSLPALAINEKVVLSGRIPSVEELKEIILKNSKND